MSISDALNGLKMLQESFEKKNDRSSEQNIEKVKQTMAMLRVKMKQEAEGERAAEQRKQSEKNTRISSGPGYIRADLAKKEYDTEMKERQNIAGTIEENGGGSNESKVAASMARMGKLKTGEAQNVLDPIQQTLLIAKHALATGDVDLYKASIKNLDSYDYVNKMDAYFKSQKKLAESSKLVTKGVSHDFVPSVFIDPVNNVFKKFGINYEAKLPSASNKFGTSAQKMHQAIMDKYQSDPKFNQTEFYNELKKTIQDEGGKIDSRLFPDPKTDLITGNANSLDVMNKILGTNSGEWTKPMKLNQFKSDFIIQNGLMSKPSSGEKETEPEITTKPSDKFADPFAPSAPAPIEGPSDIYKDESAADDNAEEKYLAAEQVD